jgi:uncharacterized protein GlcG (DUF336 family)
MPKLLTSYNIGRDLARIGIERAVEESLAVGCLTCIAVLDSGGHLISYDRMDGAPFQSAQFARDKAYSVVGNGMANDEFWNMIKDDPWLVSGVSKVSGLVWLGGGVPVVHHDTLIGAVGVSGKSTMDQDKKIAQAGANAIAQALGQLRPGEVT